jgi:dephospho-CoA kinase
VVIGLTGGIGSGKSTVAQFLSQLGAVILNTDEMGHELFQPYKEAWREIVATFGRGVLQPNDEIDRSKLSEVVFNDPQARARLNQIMHPRILELVKQRIQQSRLQGAEVIVVEAALLMRVNWPPLLDEVWVTVAPEAVAIERTCNRSGLTPAQVKARIRSQLPVEEMVKQADVVIDTHCDLAELKAKVEELWGRLASK